MFIVVETPFVPNKIYCSSNETYRVGESVIVEDTTKEEVFGTVISFVSTLPQDYKEEARDIVRKATVADEERQKECLIRAEDAFSFCKLEIRNQMLSMKLIAVEMVFTMTKLIFYFTAPERVDFRGLIKTLVGRYRERIELRQIGVRNEVQLLGGIGSCGRNCCCTTFLRDFIPVSVKTVKQNNGVLNPLKMSGVCGRLSCCLPYEGDKEQ